MNTRYLLALLAITAARGAPQVQTVLPNAKPIPRMQAVPMMYDQVSFQPDEKEIARFHFGSGLNRPFVFPVIGPSGHMLTRMGHPGDPDTHSHHNSIWIAYGKVNGIDFWGDRPGSAHGRIIHQRIVDLDDSDSRAGIITQANWKSGRKEVGGAEPSASCLPARFVSAPGSHPDLSTAIFLARALPVRSRASSPSAALPISCSNCT